MNMFFSDVRNEKRRSESLLNRRSHYLTIGCGVRIRTGGAFLKEGLGDAGWQDSSFSGRGRFVEGL